MIPTGKAAMLMTGALASVGLIFSATSSRSETAATEREPRQLRVLDSQEVILGPRSMIYNRVETPSLLPQPAPAERAAARAEREAAWAAHEQWLKDNPPQPKDTIIQFFPIRSRLHVNATEGTALE